LLNINIIIAKPTIASFAYVIDVNKKAYLTTGKRATAVCV